MLLSVSLVLWPMIKQQRQQAINAFYLGVERVCSQSSILVRYVGKRGVYDADGKAARQLIAAGVKMMAQYTYTTAVATVCAENDTPLIGNDVNLISLHQKMR